MRILFPYSLLRTSKFRVRALVLDLEVGQPGPCGTFCKGLGPVSILHGPKLVGSVASRQVLERYSRLIGHVEIMDIL